MPDIFDSLRDTWPDKAVAWDLGNRPVLERSSDARVLDSDVMVVAVTSEPVLFRQTARDWPDRDAATWLAESAHQREMQRAAKPPVIEVTVTTPPGGMPRADLDRLVRDKIAETVAPTGPSQLPNRARNVLTVTPRRGNPRLPDSAAADAPTELLPVSEDDIDTGTMPAVRDDGEGWAHVENVPLP